MLIKRIISHKDINRIQVLIIIIIIVVNNNCNNKICLIQIDMRIYFKWVKFHKILIMEVSYLIEYWKRWKSYKFCFNKYPLRNKKMLKIKKHLKINLM